LVIVENENQKSSYSHWWFNAEEGEDEDD
jgi:hypothetical protein